MHWLICKEIGLKFKTDFEIKFQVGVKNLFYGQTQTNQLRHIWKAVDLLRNAKGLFYLFFKQKSKN